MWWFRVSLLAVIGIVLVGSPPWHVLAFNVETKHYAVYRNEPKSMFGFSVTGYRDGYGRGWAIVGAPEAQTNQPGIVRGGAIYRCDLRTDDRCDRIPFDINGHNHAPLPAGGTSRVDNKTLQWFGATVSASSKDGGPLLGCAPRYVWFNRRFDTRHGTYVPGNRRDPIGTCWMKENFGESKEFSPCRTDEYPDSDIIYDAVNGILLPRSYTNWGYHRQGSCQAGLGAAVSKNSERIFIGAPGSWYWQGQVSSHYVNGRPKIIYTQEGPASEDDSYMGYSVASGDFRGNGDSGVAVGVPRGSGLRGKVVLLTSNMSNYQNITGDLMGAYFGYSVAACDVDGDKLDDLLVGAPMYTIEDNSEMTIETGRVYVFYQSHTQKFHKFDTRDGESNRGRFGLSLACLGDIDLDGYGDFAVGAPYGGPNGRGIVYIYHGSEHGVLEKYSQAIYAEDLDVPVQTFGFSVGGGLDLDGNRYPDLVVGSYESSTAMFFRARPVIKMDSYVAFDSHSKTISLENRNCTLSSGSRVTCLPLRACFKYTGEGVLSRHNFNIQYVLDVKKIKNPRMFFLELEGMNTMNHTITVDRDQQFCRTVQVYVTSVIRDKLTSLDAEMRMSLTEERQADTRRRDPQVTLRPVLGVTTSRKDSLSILKNCGTDNICIPNLRLTVRPNVAKYLLGSAEKLKLETTVENTGEDAFEATYHLKLPDGIKYINIERNDKTGVPVQCSAPMPSNNNTLKCDIGNPLPRNQFVHFNVSLQPIASDGMKQFYDFDMEVNTTNPENPSTVYDNRQHLTLPIWVETKLRITGESKQKDIYYDPNNETLVNVTNEADFGPAMTHNYTIRNQGPSDILDAEAYLIWPAQTLAGDVLVYLLEQPEKSGKVHCDLADANYLNLKLDPRKKVSFDYSEASGVILDESKTGRNVNVQTGFRTQTQQNVTQEELASSGDSSVVQKSRQSSKQQASHTSSSRILLSGKETKVLTSHSQNLSESSGGTISTGGLSGGGTSVILDTQYTTGSYGTSTSWDGLITSSQRNVFGPGTSSSQSQGSQTSWIETSERNREVQTDTDRRYQELIRQQEEQRRRLEIEEQRRREEARRLDEKRQEETRRWEQEERIRIQERTRLDMERRRKEEEERRRLQLVEEERRRHEEEERRKQQTEEEYEYDEDGYDSATEHYGTTSGIVTGDREDTIGTSNIGLQLRNVTSTQEIERYFGSLSKNASYQLYNRQGHHYVQFMARFRTNADREEYIEFQDHSRFPLQDYTGRPSYVSSSSEPRDGRFLRMEGQLMISQDGKGYIVLKDGRRFPLQGSYTYTEERTYNLGGGARGSSSTRVTQDYDRWYEESPKHDDNASYDQVYGSRSHEERRTEERRTDSRTYTRTHGQNRFDDNAAIHDLDPNHLNSRIRRESDMVEVEDFKKFEKRRRHRRDAGDHLTGDTVKENESKSDPLVIPPCESAKCVSLVCRLGPMKKDEEVWIAARYRVSAATLKKVAVNEKVKVSTKLITRVTRQPFIGEPKEEVKASFETYTNVEPKSSPAAPDIIPLWVVVLSACAGVIILLLLIYLLYKCGFFKRNRPSDAPERQPLNRNGHFQADDHM